MHDLASNPLYLLALVLLCLWMWMERPIRPGEWKRVIRIIKGWFKKESK